MKVIKIYACILFCVMGFMAAAQPVIVQASVDKQKVLLGEPFWLTLKIKYVGNSDLRFVLDTIPHFELVGIDSITKSHNSDTTLIRQYFQLISFDSGQWVIPAIPLLPGIKTNPITMQVVFSQPFDPNQPYHDIQDVRNVPEENTLLRSLAWILPVVIFIMVLLYFILRRKKDAEPIAKAKPYEHAIRRLQKLQHLKKNTAAYYIQLVDIFREYISLKTGIESLQQTSEDLLQQLRSLVNDESKYENLSKTLLLGDFIKFAKYTPTEDESASGYDVIANAIKKIETKVNSKLTDQM